MVNKPRRKRPTVLKVFYLIISNKSVHVVHVLHTDKMKVSL